MVNINLLGKRKRRSQRRSWVVTLLVVVFSLFTLYFLSLSAYVVIRLSMTASEQSRIDSEATTLSKEMVANDELLRKFVLSKYILEKMRSLSVSKFPYRDFLDSLVSFLPSGVSLKTVDFSNKGWVAAVVSTDGVIPMRQLELSLSENQRLAESPFMAIFVENVSRDKQGAYIIKLQLELKKDAGR